MKKWKIWTAVAALTMTAGFSVQAEESQDMMTSYLTGKQVSTEIGSKRPVAIMFNNIIDAIPQAGIANADVVYEAPVEGGITRLMGIMEDYEDASRIGSVRSCRNYYVYYATEFDAIYSHFGQAVYALDLLERPEVDNLSGLSDYGSTVYYRSDDRVAPHNVYTTAERLEQGIEMCGYDRYYPEDYAGHYQFAADGEVVDLAAQGGVTANKVTPGYAFNSPWFEYNAEDGKYYRFQYGDAQIDELTNEQLSYDNILIQISHWEPYDENGYLNIDTYTGMDGYYITQGYASPVTWQKDSEWGATRYYDPNGQEITLNQGKTWVCIVQDTYRDNIVLE